MRPILISLFLISLIYSGQDKISFKEEIKSQLIGGLPAGLLLGGLGLGLGFSNHDVLGEEHIVITYMVVGHVIGNNIGHLIFRRKKGPFKLFVSSLTGALLNYATYQSFPRKYDDIITWTLFIVPPPIATVSSYSVMEMIETNRKREPELKLSLLKINF